MGEFLSFHNSRSSLIHLRCLRPRLVCHRATFTFNAPQDLRDPCHSSAKDQLTGQSVAIKKIMKPFSTPVLSKRTYRELKLLKHIQHENVRVFSVSVYALTYMQTSDHRTQRCIHLPLRRLARIISSVFITLVWLWLLRQVFRNRTTWNWLASPFDLEAAGKTVHPILSLPNPRAYQCQLYGPCLEMSYSAWPQICSLSGRRPSWSGA